MTALAGEAFTEKSISGSSPPLETAADTDADGATGAAVAGRERVRVATKRPIPRRANATIATTAMIFVDSLALAGGAFVCAGTSGVVLPA